MGDMSKPSLPTKKRKQIQRVSVMFCLACFPAFISTVLADDLTDCISSMIGPKNDAMTVGELRLLCKKMIHEGSFNGGSNEVAVASDRFRKDSEHVLEPYTLMSHKPNYILLGAYNSHSYNPDLFRSQYRVDTIELDDTEAQFQISVKTPLLLNVLDTFDLYAAYSNRSFWQYYNSSISSPFRETNHEPEMWAQFRSDYQMLGLNNSANMLGIVHQSNGQGGILSRSWNRVYVNFIFDRGNFALAFKPWYRLPESSSDDDNPDITDYLGHAEFYVAYKRKKYVLSAMFRNNIESEFERGAVQLSWSFPLWEYPYLKGYIQYFSGYGESMIDYDQYVNRIGVGFILTDIL